jgi:hypothetical protein
LSTRFVFPQSGSLSNRLQNIPFIAYDGKAHL